MSETSRYELVFSQAAWQNVMPRLLTDPNLVAVGRLWRNDHPGACELLASHLDVRTEVPRGAQFPPLTDWAIVACPRQGPRLDPAAWISEIEPRPSQLATVVLVGAGADRSQWRAHVIQGAAQFRVAALRVIGSGMPRTDEDEGSFGDDRNKAEERWHRTRGALGERTLQKLRHSNVLLLAAGGSGSAIAWQLAALGVRRLRIVDPDVIEASNLDRMFAVEEADIGTSKAEAIGRHLLALRPDLALGVLPSSASDPAIWQAARDADLVVTAADNSTPDLVASLICRRLLKVHLSVGSGITEQDGRRILAADARLLLPMEGCATCVGGLVNEEQARYELRAPLGTMQRGEPADAGRLGSLVTLNSMNVSIGVQCWLDLLAGSLRTSFWHRLEWVAGEGVRVHAGPVGAGQHCPICHFGVSHVAA